MTEAEKRIESRIFGRIRPTAAPVANTPTLAGPTILPRVTLATLHPFKIRNAGCPSCDGDLWFYPVSNSVVCLTCPVGPTMEAILKLSGPVERIA